MQMRIFEPQCVRQRKSQAGRVKTPCRIGKSIFRNPQPSICDICLPRSGRQRDRFDLALPGCIAAAKGRGVYKGSQPPINAAEVRRLSQEEKLRATAIARRPGIDRASVYRVRGRPACLSAAGQ